MLLNDHRIIIGILYEQQAAVCLYDPVALPWQHIASCHFDHKGDTT